MPPKSAKKPKKLTPKQQIELLTTQNEDLTKQLEQLRVDHDNMTIKVLGVTKKVLEGVNKKDFGINDNTEILSISPETLMDMVGKLIVKKRIYDMSVEARADELELRVTQMNGDLARMMKKTLAYEQGLSDIGTCLHIEDVRDRIQHLQLIAGEQFHHFTSHDILENKHSSPILNGHSRPNTAAKLTLENAVKLNLVPPDVRLPGETHIMNMNRDLRLLVIKELSMQKPSGSDWRMVAERVGIAAETVSYWAGLRLECPMGRVLSEWGDSQQATVRQLHRHLMSPQMRQTILAKKIADFYEVD